MSRNLSAGPAAGAAWAAWAAYPAAAGPATPVLAVPDAANAQRAAAGLPDLYYGLPAAPRLAYDQAGQPVLSLTLLLARRPGPDDDSIFELVESAVLACDLTLALPPGAAGDTLEPLFARDVGMRLEAVGDAAAAALAEGQGFGAAARVSLGARLGRAAAQGVLRALHGMESGLALRCRLAYRSAGERRSVRMKIRWAQVHDLLSPHVGDDGSLTGATVRALLPDMVEAGALEASQLGAGPAESPLAPAQAGSLWGPFMMFSAPLLERLTLSPAPASEEARFALRARPDEGAGLDTSTAIDTAREEETTLHAPLEDVIGKALDGIDAGRVIRLVCSDPGAPDGVAEAPRRIRARPRSRAAGPPPAGARGLAMVGGDAVSLTRALEPDRRARAPAAALLASDVVRLHPGRMQSFSAHALELDRIDQPAEPVLPLPRIDDGGAPFWPDQADPNHFWYAPEYTVAAPDPTAAPGAGSFLFSFHEAGHDASGRPVLEGSVRFTLQRGPSAATRQALAERAGVRADPVPQSGLSASLSLPLRDDQGKLVRVELAAQLTENGDTIVAEVPLLNDYVRVAYGDLAFAGFQAEPARLQVYYVFDAMVPVSQFPVALQFADKLQMTAVAYSLQQQKELAGRPHLDALRMIYRGVAADLQFRREAGAEPARELALAEAGAAAEGGEEAPPPRAPGPAVLLAGTRLQTAGLQPAQMQLTPAIRPELDISVRLQELVGRRRYARQAQGRSIPLDLLFPCSAFPALYRQQSGDGSASVGCQDSLSLGQAPLKLYEQVTDPALASPKYKLYKSLTQPGHFLVLPAAYLITRYGPAEGERAWRPTLYLYSTLDPATAANNRCVLMAALQPDLSPWERHELESRLTLPHQPPAIEYVTALDSEVQYTWALPGAGAKIDVEAVRLWDSFQVTLTTDLTGALLLQSMLTHSGLSGQAQFRLADGTVLASTLLLDLNRVTGPWGGGPVEVAPSGQQATLTNRIERPVAVADLAVAGADGTPATVRCERTLKPAEAVTLDLPLAAAQAWVDYAIPPGDPATLTAINSFVENIHVNVVFVNLIDFANHNLAKLSLEARIKEAPGTGTPVNLSADQPVAEARYVLPLTVYQGPRTLQYQVTKTDGAGAVSTTAWLESDLAAGNVVSLVWSLIQ
jgi:hypothetical protein